MKPEPYHWLFPVCYVKIYKPTCAMAASCTSAWYSEVIHCFIKLFSSAPVDYSGIKLSKSHICFMLPQIPTEKLVSIEKLSSLLVGQKFSKNSDFYILSRQQVPSVVTYQPIFLKGQANVHFQESVCQISKSKYS